MPISSRSALLKLSEVLSKCSARTPMGVAVSGRKARSARMPGRFSSTLMYGMTDFLNGVNLFYQTALRIPFFRSHRRAIDICLLVLRCPGIEPVHISIEHAECGGDQYRIMNFTVRGAERSGEIDLCCRYLFASLLHAAGNGQQGFQFV